MRKFWLKNGSGDVYELTDHGHKVFLNEPNNLGYTKTISVSRYGNAQIARGEVYDFPAPAGVLVFYGTNAERYAQYNDLMRWLMVKPISLYYQLPSGQTFNIDCEVVQVDKDESKNGVMACNVQFNGLSFWKGEKVSESFYSFANLNNAGDLPAGAKLVINGSITDPFVKYSNENGALYGEAKFNGTFSKVTIESADGRESVALEAGGAVLPNPLGFQDLSISNGAILVTFVKLKRGATRLELGSAGDFNGSATIEYTPQYISV